MTARFRETLTEVDVTAYRTGNLLIAKIVLRLTVVFIFWHTG